MSETAATGFRSLTAVFRFRFDASEKLLAFARQLRREKRCKGASIAVISIDSGECLLVCTWRSTAGAEVKELVSALHAELHLLYGSPCLGYMFGPSATL